MAFLSLPACGGRGGEGAGCKLRTRGMPPPYSSPASGGGDYPLPNTPVPDKLLYRPPPSVCT
jgi:hypothetical protein